MLLKFAAVAGLIGVAALPATGAAQDFSWNGSVANGQTVEIRGVNGGIRVVPGTGRTVSVTAEKHSRRSDTESVRIQVIEHAQGITICAVYPTPESAKRENECKPGGGSMSTDNNDVAVDFVVRLPSNAHLKAGTVNGEVEAEGLTGNVQASSVNGSVTVSTRGSVRASTVNGSIHAAMGAVALGEDLRFSTVNGSIELEVPSDFSADLTFSSVSGDVESDFPLTITRGIARQKVEGRIGAGGRTLTASTVNGDLILKKRF